MSVTNLTNYKWVGNDHISVPSSEKVYDIDLVWIHFVSVYEGAPVRYNNTYSELILNYTSQTVMGLVYRSEDTICPAYLGDSTSGAWDSLRRTIIIKGGNDVTNPTLIAWLEANGTLTKAYAPTPTISQSNDRITISNIDQVIGKIDLYKDGVFFKRIDTYSTFNISYNLIGGTIDNAPQTTTNKNWEYCHMTLKPNDECKLPSSIEVSGSSYTYDTFGDIVLTSPTDDITVSATCPEATPFALKIDVSSARVQVQYNDNTTEWISEDCVVDNVKVILDVDYDYDGDYGRGIWDENGDVVSSTLPFTLTKNNYTVYAYSEEEEEPICFVEGTKITLKDGSYKNVEDITYDDELLVWDFYTKQKRSIKPIWILPHKYSASFYCKITLSDGTVLNLAGPDFTKTHRLYNVDRNSFEYPQDFKEGERTINANGEFLTIKSIENIKGDIKYYNIITDTFYNLYAEDILTSCRLSNRYGIKNMKYNLKDVKMTQEEVEEYMKRCYSR